MVHRDIKPGNVLVDRESNVKVVDFGLARLMDATVEGNGVATADFVYGTPDYMAPEQRRDMDVDHRADIYSLGIMTYEMLCGEVPRGAFQLPSQRIGCDARIDQIVLKAMQQAPEMRYQSTQAMEADIEAARMPVPVARPVAVARPMAVAKPVTAARPAAPPRPQPVVARPVAAVPPIFVPQTPVHAYAQEQAESSAKSTWMRVVIAGGVFLVAIILYLATGDKTPKQAPKNASVSQPANVSLPTPQPVVARVVTPTPRPVEVSPSPADSNPSQTDSTKPEQTSVNTSKGPTETQKQTSETDPRAEVEKWLADIDTKQQEAFQQQVIKVYDTGVSNLHTRYIAAMDARLAKASASGQLDQALAWRNEKQHFTTDQTVAADVAETPPEIRAIRADFRQKITQLEAERLGHAKQLFAAYDAILVKNSTLLTQRQRLDDALMLHTKRKELAKAWGVESQLQPTTSPPPTQQPTSAVKPLAAAVAPSPKITGPISLLSLTPAKEPVIGYGKLTLGGDSFFGDPVSVNGEACTQWLGAHAESKMVYAVPFGTKTFTAYGVRPNNERINGSWRYIVRFDGVQAFRSKPLNEYDNFQVLIEVSVPVGAKLMELSVDEMGSYRMDHAVWALPTFKK